MIKNKNLMVMDGGIVSKLISIIIPAYNAEKHIDHCLESLVLQSYRDLEIILVNDKSTDRTGEKADYWAEKDNRITVIHNIANIGIASSRNVGIEMARGRYIGFVDADDFVHCKFYERMHTLLVENDADISVCNEEAFIDGNTEPEFDREPVGTMIQEDHDRYVEHFMDGFTGHIGWCWNKLYRADYLKHIRFREYAYEDIVFNAEYSKFVKKAVWTRDRMYAYRISEESVTAAGKRNLSLPAAKSFVATKCFLTDNSRGFADRYQMYVLGKVANIYANCRKHFGKEAAAQVYELFLEEYKLRNCHAVSPRDAFKLWLVRYAPFTYCIMATGDDK